MAESTPAHVDGKTCTKCGKFKPLDQYYRRGDKLYAHCKACHKIMRDKWRAENPTYNADYYQRNREKLIAAAIEYAKQNPPDPERTRQWARERYAANADRQRARKYEWMGANPEAVAETRRRAMSRRRARLRGLPTERYTMDELIERDGTACVLCGEELDLDAVYPDPWAPTVEHLECIQWPGSAGDGADQRERGPLEVQ